MKNSQVDRAILTALSVHALIADTTGWSVRVAPGGSTDRTFTIIDPADQPTFTARLARAGLDAWLQREAVVLRELAVADGGLTPARITLISAEGHLPADLLVHEHLPGKNAPVDEVSVAARERLGEALAWVHRQSRDGYMIWPALDIQHGTRADNYRARCASLRRYRTAALPDIATRIDAFTTASSTLSGENGWHEPGFALIHGDLSPGNILWDGDAVHLIDWEFARDGDPAEDLAYLISQGNITPETFSDIAEAYVIASGDPWALARIGIWLPLVQLDAALWWADWEAR